MQYRSLAFLPLVAVLTVPLAAQIPQGHYVFSTFGSTGSKGLFHAHPRNPGLPTTVTGLAGDLLLSGGACVAYRASDGALIVGERAMVGGSVDVHVIELRGDAVVRDASFSVGTGGSCCGEVPQLGLLPDGRVVVTATDVAAGPLSMYLTTSYGYQGVGILDTTSGLVTPVPISNGAQIVDVFNALAIAPDASAVYLGCWDSADGEIWRLPLPAGGVATLVARLPFGLSNMSFDAAGTLWCTTLDATQPLFRVDVTSGTVTAVATNTGALNAIAAEAVTGHFAIVSSSAGAPSRSLFWLEANGNEHLLSSPGFATPSGVSLQPNPAPFGDPAAHAWFWRQPPHAAGLPLVGNQSFAVTVVESSPQTPTVAVMTFCSRRLASPRTIFGTEVVVDLSTLLYAPVIAPSPSVTLQLPIPNDPALAGAALYLQSFHMDASSTFTSSQGLAITVL